ncbi:MAG: menaquinone biosynthesis protein [Desulfobacterales bacterium]|nr:menaquinone biosynthesis protein [Desulfobacterales bacterium]
MSKVKLGKITYINASPVYYGLDEDARRGANPEWLEMVPDVPAALNRKILAGEVDISPISAAFYAMHHESLLLVPDFSISCHGPVLSVICASRVPLAELDGKNVLFSKESASGASFFKMIFSTQGIQPQFQVGPVGDMDGIDSEVDAVVVIGDDALTQPWETRFPHRIDLGQAWLEMTGLPFVFAVWAIRREFARKFPERVNEVIRLLNASRRAGDAHMDVVVDAGQRRLGLSRARIREYYDHLYCDLDSEKEKGMALFFDSLYREKILETPARITYFQY